MNRKKAEKLEKKAEAYLGRTVTLMERNKRGAIVEEEYILKDIHGFSFETNIRSPEEMPNPDDMFHHMTAILVKDNGKDKIDVIPLEEVLESIKNNTVINYNRWF